MVIPWPKFLFFRWLWSAGPEIPLVVSKTGVVPNDVFAVLFWEFDRMVRIVRWQEISGKVGLINKPSRISAFAS
jgi:hypothetical protein